MLVRNGGEKLRTKKNGLGSRFFFADKYHNLKITQKLRTGHMGCHSANNVVLTREISPVLDNLTMVVTAYQSHVDRMIKKIRQLAETNLILRDHIKKFAKAEIIMRRQVQEEKIQQKNKIA